MTAIWAQAALWLGLALVATLLSIKLRVATALSEIVVGTVAQLIVGAALGGALLAGDATWIKFLSGWHRPHRGRPSRPRTVRALADRFGGAPGDCLRPVRGYGGEAVRTWTSG